jgi:uncharacterized membrane protein YphA (DoxX/SURF4 family)
MNRTATILLRLSLAASFLSAVADRFGLWGPPGAKGVAWGNFQQFVDYTATLTFRAASVPLAWVATVCEVGIAIALLVGWKLRETALASGALLTTFALSMAFALSPKAPLDYSVFTAAAASFALAALVRR